MNAKFAKVIVVHGRTGMPMYFEMGKQFCYAKQLSLKSIKQTGPKVTTYQRQDALILITASNVWRIRKGCEPIEYRLVLVEHGKC